GRQTKDEALAVAQARLRELALQVPNPAAADVPDGGEDDAVALKTVGAETSAPELDHAAFGEAIGFVETAAAAEASGSRFAYIMREAALLELALVNYAMRIVTEHGFVPVVTPTLVRQRTTHETGLTPD